YAPYFEKMSFDEQSPPNLAIKAILYFVPKPSISKQTVAQSEDDFPPPEQAATGGGAAKTPSAPSPQGTEVKTVAKASPASSARETAPAENQADLQGEKKPSPVTKLPPTTPPGEQENPKPDERLLAGSEGGEAGEGERENLPELK